MKVDYQIMSVPSYILFDCPYCNWEEVDVSFDNVNFVSDCWGDGGDVRCPHCNKKMNQVIMFMIKE